MYDLADLPQTLVGPVSAGLDWVNTREDRDYELTGLADLELDIDVAEPFELSLILCDGETCAARRIAFTPSQPGYSKSGFSMTQVPDTEPDIPALLDPPEGLRSGWVDEQLAKFEFILLLYYRGRW
ncbi:MAG: hypothetical protein AAF541_21820 [Pseudomonadota bacterium]